MADVEVGGGRAHDVRVHVPATPGYLQVLRTVAAGATARAGANVDEVADIKLAVDEAAAWLLEDCPDASAVRLSLGRSGRSIEIVVGVRVEPHVEWPGAEFTNSLGWKVVSALCDVAQPIDDDEGPAIRLVRRLSEELG
jgi:serine/threonine-protein kinase RsbW